MSLRKFVFWIHLVAGLVAGAVIGIMSFTGVTLAFEKEIIAWAERDLRSVTPPTADSKHLPLDDLMVRIRDARPDSGRASLTLDADPNVAILASLGRTNTFHVDPYTGVVHSPGAQGLRRFMQLMIDWHRYVAQGGESRPVGKAITGACNLVFLFLGVSGLYLWWPRQWNRSSVRASALFNFQLAGKARDWNWHNVIGLWCAPLIIIVTATATPISYQWAGKLIHTLTGTQFPTPRPQVRKSTSHDSPPKPAPGHDTNSSIVESGIELSALVDAAQKARPNWKQITLRPPIDSQPVTITIREKNNWPLFATIQLTLDPQSASVVREETYASYDAGLKLRRWTRFLHTGEALGPIGQMVAGLASLGGVFLVWTGFALAWRRFFGQRPARQGASTSGQ
jgi:uncharacterized iron-regulated membrane protein